jgi:hypothetical protein
MPLLEGDKLSNCSTASSASLFVLQRSQAAHSKLHVHLWCSTVERDGT